MAAAGFFSLSVFSCDFITDLHKIKVKLNNIDKNQMKYNCYLQVFPMNALNSINPNSCQISSCENNRVCFCLLTFGKNYCYSHLFDYL